MQSCFCRPYQQTFLETYRTLYLLRMAFVENRLQADLTRQIEEVCLLPEAGGGTHVPH